MKKNKKAPKYSSGGKTPIGLKKNRTYSPYEWNSDNDYKQPNPKYSMKTDGDNMVDYVINPITPMARSTNTSVNSDEKEGFNFKMDMAKMSPYANTLAQLALSKKAPKVPKPRLVEAANLDTDIDVSDQVEASNQAEMRNRMAINQNSRTVGQAIGGNTSIGMSAMQNLNKIYGNKERSETQLRNQDAMNKQQVQGQNQQIMSANDQMKMARKAEMVRAQSGALNRLNQEVQMDSAESKRMDRDKAVALMMSLRDNGRGIVPNKLVGPLAKALNIPEDEVKKLLGGINKEK